MSKQAALDRLHSRFTYKVDRWDDWKLMGDDGPVEGDCEDFALTLIKELEGGRFWRPLLKGRYRLYFCKIRGDGHAVLYDAGSGLFADNVNRKWLARAQLRDRHYHSFDRLGFLTVAWRLFRGWWKSR